MLVCMALRCGCRGSIDIQGTCLRVRLAGVVRPTSTTTKKKHEYAPPFRVGQGGFSLHGAYRWRVDVYGDASPVFEKLGWAELS